MEKTSVNYDLGRYDLLGKRVKKMNSNMKGLVLDLRNNPGGLLDQAISAWPKITEFIKQKENKKEDFNSSSSQLIQMFGG